MSRRIAVLALAIAACSGDEPNLSQTQQLAVLVSPSSYDFGSRQVGSPSGDVAFSVNPGLGENYDTVIAVNESCPDFSVSAPGLPAEVYRTCYYDECPKYEVCPIQATAICQTLDYQTYDFTARFTPTVAGTVSCPVSVHLGDGTTKTLTLTGTGTPPPKAISVTPSSVSFGDVRRNTASSPYSITVRNSGGSALTVTGASVTSGFAITAGSTGQYPLSVNQSVIYQLTCNPTVVGNMTGTFTVTSDAPTSPSSVSLACRGIDSNVALSPSPTTLPTTRVGEPVQLSVAIANSGAAAMSLEGVTLSGTGLTLMGVPSNGSYGTGTVGNAVVRFDAAEGGTQSGMLTITYDGGQTRTSTVSARALATSMALTPDGDVNFGPVCAGQSSTQTFTVIANDEGPFQISQIGGATPPFTATVPTLPITVQGSGATTAQFTVTAAPETAGMQTSELNLVTDIPGAAPRTINLTVDALPEGVTPSPAALDFGSTQPLTTTLGQQVHLSNCSTTPASFSNPRIEGESATEFAIVQQPAGTTVDANGKVSWLIVLTASTPGLKRAEFVVDHDGGTARVPLDGEGLGADVGGTGDGPTEELSYYSCAATRGSSGAWALLVVVMGIVLRRRRRR